MSVLIEFSIFPLDQGVSLSAPVSQVIAMLRDSGVAYQLTAMGTLVETDTLEDALGLIARAHTLLQAQGCERIYASIRIDSRNGPRGRLQGKPAAVAARIGPVMT